MEAPVERLAPKRHGLTALLVVGTVFFVTRAVARGAGIALGGPLATVAALGAVVAVNRAMGRGLASLGLGRPTPWGRFLIVFAGAFATTLLAGVVLLPRLLESFGSTPSSGRFDYLQGNPWALALSLVGVAWFAAAFGEEVVWRGFVLPHLASLLGGGRGAWLAAVLAQALAFGLLHHGAVGMIVATVIGLGYGICFWLGPRNLWPLILAHAIPDTISFVSMYRGG